MAFDGMMLANVTNKLKETIETGRINKIYAISKYELLIHIRAHRQNFKLLISIHPVYARVQLSDLSYPTPTTPSSLTMLLRKHLEGAYIELIEQVELERIVHLSIIGTNEFKDTIKYHMYIEIMGKTGL